MGEAAGLRAGECGYLDGALGMVAKEMGETDGKVEKSVRSVDSSESAGDGHGTDVAATA
ncbi:hypothetical protein [Streptomyces niveus]|uniref:hypothetical protein n=1 Tax=Streptomyces niveus TaxID=193462 RepID=UPI0033D1D305